MISDEQFSDYVVNLKPHTEKHHADSKGEARYLTAAKIYSPVLQAFTNEVIIFYILFLYANSHAYFTYKDNLIPFKFHSNFTTTNSTRAKKD